MKIRIGEEPDQSQFQNRPEFSPELKNPTTARALHQKKRGTFVSEGTFLCRRLRYNSQYLSLPDGSSAITSMAAAEDGVIYGATSGECVHVFAYNPRPPFDTVALLAKLDGETDCRRAMVWEREGAVLVGTRCTGAPSKGWPGGALYRITGMPFYFDAVQEWPRGFGESEKLCVPVQGEGIAALVIDRARGRVYGLSDKTAVLFSYDLESKKVKKYGSMDPLWHFSENLLLAPSGDVLTTAAGNRLVRFDAITEKITLLDATVPTFPGRSLYARIDSHVWDPRSRVFYIGDKADGLLYTLNPETLETRLIGKPTDRIRVRAMAAAHDGRVFGIAGAEGDIAQMFVYEPGEQQVRNLGIPMATVEERHYGFEFDSAVTGRDGQIYFGESEWTSHLFVYFPSQPAPRVADEVPF
jgi:hypothetical protein